MTWSRRVRIFASLIVFSLWFGGFGFYAAVVVPTGTEEFGAFEQARVTRPVSSALHWICGVLVLLMLIDFRALRQSQSADRSRVTLVTIGVLAAGLIGSVILHRLVDRAIDWSASDFPDYDQFYFFHRLYLLTLTAQWIAALVWLFQFVSRAD